MQPLPTLPGTSAPAPQNYFTTGAAASPSSIPPPQTAQELQAYLQRSNGTPATTNASPDPLQARRSIDSIANATPVSKASPSDMFGGVDQLLRTSDNGQDWWMRDQSQLAMGFDNWTDAEAAGAWFAAGMPDSGMQQPPSSTSPPFAPTSGGPIGGSARPPGAPLGAEAMAHSDALRKALNAMRTANAAGTGPGTVNPPGTGPNGRPVGPANGHVLPAQGLAMQGFNGALGYDESQWYS